MDYIVRAVIQAVQLITSFDDSVISILHCLLEFRLHRL